MIVKYYVPRLGVLLALLTAMTGCTLGPDYQRPEVTMPTEYREAAPWKEANPADALDKGDWWQV